MTILCPSTTFIITTIDKSESTEQSKPARYQQSCTYNKTLYLHPRRVLCVLVDHMDLSLGLSAGARSHHEYVDLLTSASFSKAKERDTHTHTHVHTSQFAFSPSVRPSDCLSASFVAAVPTAHLLSRLLGQGYLSLLFATRTSRPCRDSRVCVDHACRCPTSL